MGLFALIACNNPKNNPSEQTSMEATNVGGEKDEHGCLVAAGETWSDIKQSCIQVFSTGQRLNPVDVSGSEAVISAFVLFNEDKSELELFLPNGSKTVILNKGEEGVYQNDSLSFDAKESTLYIYNERRYKAE